MDPRIRNVAVLVLFAATLMIISPVPSSKGDTTVNAQPAQSPRDWLDSTPLLGEIGPLLYQRTGFTYRCNECHNDFQNLIKYYQPAGEHSRMDTKQVQSREKRRQDFQKRYKK